jgi:hypothetical protein
MTMTEAITAGLARAKEQTMADEGTAVPTNGNKRLARLDVMLATAMTLCLLGEAALAAASFVWAPADWTTVNETRNHLHSFARDIFIGYIALSIPKGSATG